MELELEWDEAKRLSNLDKHDLDFIDADELFSKPHISEPAKEVEGEVRRKAIGQNPGAMRRPHLYRAGWSHSLHLAAKGAQA